MLLSTMVSTAATIIGAPLYMEHDLGERLVEAQRPKPPPQPMTLGEEAPSPVATSRW
jgi:hypothetical protein